MEGQGGTKNSFQVSQDATDAVELQCYPQRRAPWYHSEASPGTTLNPEGLCPLSPQA